MKNKRESHFCICFWLGIIAFLLLCGVIIFAAYLYKFTPLSLFSDIFHLDGSLGWTALNAIGTIVIGIFTIIISYKVAIIQNRQADIQNRQADIQNRQADIQDLQNKLYTEPHILIDSIEFKSINLEATNDGKRIKTIKGVDYPFFTNRIGESSFSESSLITLTFVNTSEAFARLRFNEATITQGDETIAKFDISTFGIHNHHIMLYKNGQAKIGFVINNKTISKMNHTEMTISCFLDNNYGKTYKDVQSYIIINQADGLFSFMPMNLKQNSYIEV